DFFSINKMLITPQSTRSIIERMNRTAQLAQEMLITEAMRCGLLLSTPPVAREEKSRSREKPLTKTSYTINLLPPNRPDDHKFILQSSFIIFLSYLNKNGLFTSNTVLTASRPMFTRLLDMRRNFVTKTTKFFSNSDFSQ